MTVAEPSIQFSESQPFGSEAANFPPVTSRKIALLGYRSHPFVGGQGIYLKYLSRALGALGHEVHVISGPPYPDLDINIPLIKVPSLELFEQRSHIKALRPRHLTSYSDTFEWWSMLTGGFPEPYTFGRRIQKILRHSDYDIVHDNQSLCSGLLALQKKGLNIVTTIHHPIHRDRDIALKTAIKWSDRLLIRRWYSFLRMQKTVAKNLHNVITVSRTSQNDIQTYFARSTRQTPIISNGIDTQTFCPRPEVSRTPRRIITTASSDQPLKGLRYLLTAVAAIRNQYPNVQLCIIGSLKKYGETAKQLDTLQLQNNTCFRSGITTEKLVEEYAKSSVAVCPSLYEGFGMPAGEAMSCGVPVVATDGGAMPEVVGNAGIIVPAADSQAIAREIKYIFDNPAQAQALGKRARQHIIESFCWEKVALQLSNYYESIISRAHH